jgi:hypothetical protein
MPRAYRKGYLSLSLVTCPIELFPATSQAEKTHFHQINTQAGHRLRQQMVDEETGRVVDAEHKGRGYELTKGRYVEINEDELKAIQIESIHTVDIDGFVPTGQHREGLSRQPYYIAPDGKTGAEAFVVIRDAMQDEKRVALARVVMAHREHIIKLEPLGTHNWGRVSDPNSRFERPHLQGPGSAGGYLLDALRESLFRMPIGGKKRDCMPDEPAVQRSARWRGASADVSGHSNFTRVGSRWAGRLTRAIIGEPAISGLVARKQGLEHMQDPKRQKPVRQQELPNKSEPVQGQPANDRPIDGQGITKDGTPGHPFRY